MQTIRFLKKSKFESDSTKKDNPITNFLIDEISHIKFQDAMADKLKSFILKNKSNHKYFIETLELKKFYNGMIGTTAIETSVADYVIDFYYGAETKKYKLIAVLPACYVIADQEQNGFVIHFPFDNDIEVYIED